jgi:plasmid maintenance system antidote protein VapI
VWTCEVHPCNLSAGSALRLAKFFGNSPDYWTNLQLRWILYFAQQSEKKALDTIRPYKPHVGAAA